MPAMTDKVFAQNAASLTEAIEMLCIRTAHSPEEIAAVAGASLGQVLTHQLGPFGAVERLRMLADVFEAQVLNSSPLIDKID